MNPTVFFGLALLASMSVVIEARERVTRVQVLQYFNNGRAHYANESQIGNMNELVYDWKLERIAKKEVGKHGGCIEETMTILDGNLQLITLLDRPKSRPDVEEALDYLAYEAGKTKMAFILAKCNKIQEGDIFFIIVDTDPNTPILPGKPGSRCPKDRPFNNNGLCATSKGYVRKGQASKGDVKKFANWISYER